MRPDASTKLQSVAPKQGPSKGLIAAIVGLVAVLAIAAVAFLSLNKSDDTDTPVAAGDTPTGALANGQGMPVFADKAKADAKKVMARLDDPADALDIDHIFELLKGVMEHTNGARPTT